MLKRFVTAEIKEDLKYYPAVALLGARQVGKTTLAVKIANSLKNSIYIDLESPQDQLKIQDPFGFFKKHHKKLIIIDEIQHHPDLFKILRGIIDQNIRAGHKHGQFLLLGSASGELLKQSSESLAGRISYINMSGFNVLEIDKPISNMQKLWLRGGYPDSYFAKDDNLAMNWNENLIRTYLERDIRQIEKVRLATSQIRILWTMMAHYQGETINHSKLAANLAVSNKTVYQYINILTDIMLVRKLMPLHTNIKKRLVKSPRYYVRDSGILHRLLGIENYDALLSNPIFGKSWEGFVMENIHSVLPKTCQTFFYRTAAADAAEIDLIIKMPNADIWAVEIKYGEAPQISKHYNRTCKDVKAKKKYVIYSGDDEFTIKNDIIIISLTRFIKTLLKDTSA